MTYDEMICSELFQIEQLSQMIQESLTRISIWRDLSRTPELPGLGGALPPAPPAPPTPAHLVPVEGPILVDLLAPMNVPLEKLRETGRRFRVVRVALGLKQGEVAAVLGCSRVHYAKVECGNNPFSVRLLGRFCVAYGAEPAALRRYLLEGGELPPVRVNGGTEKEQGQ